MTEIIDLDTKKKEKAETDGEFTIKDITNWVDGKVKRFIKDSGISDNTKAKVFILIDTDDFIQGAHVGMDCAEALSLVENFKLRWLSNGGV